MEMRAFSSSEQKKQDELFKSGLRQVKANEKALLHVESSKANKLKDSR